MTSTAGRSVADDRNAPAALATPPPFSSEEERRRATAIKDMAFLWLMGINYSGSSPYENGEWDGNLNDYAEIPYYYPEEIY